MKKSNFQKGTYKVKVARNLENELLAIFKENNFGMYCFIEYENDGGMDVAIYEVEIKFKKQYELVNNNAQSITLQF